MKYRFGLTDDRSGATDGIEENLTGFLKFVKSN